jgi:hypothetical protein
MNWSAFLRQFHRWLSIAFTVTVIANFAFMALGEVSLWVTYSPLVPLFLLLFTGLYMFMPPYSVKWHDGRRPSALERTLGRARPRQVPLSSTRLRSALVETSPFPCARRGNQKTATLTRSTARTRTNGRAITFPGPVPLIRAPSPPR